MVSMFFYEGTQRSCTAAATRVASLWEAVTGRVVSTNSGGFCSAKAKIPAEAVRQIACDLAASAEKLSRKHDDLSLPINEELAEERLTPMVLAMVRGRSITGRILMADGFTVDAADTEANQADFPQNPCQQPGLGFPIARNVGLFSATTGLLMDAQMAAYSGKGTGETNLFRPMIDNLARGDLLLADGYYCTYWILAACLARGVNVVMKNHHKREDHPKDCKPINSNERLVQWIKPDRPDWMDDAQYESVSDSITVRLVDIEIDEEGFRCESYTAATTLLDHREYDRQWIGQAYRLRWNVETDIASVKVTEGLEHLRSKDPQGMAREFWSGLLAYNLIRLKMLQAAYSRNREARSLSFATTHQLLSNQLVAVVNASDKSIDGAVKFISDGGANRGPAMRAGGASGEQTAA